MEGELNQQPGLAAPPKQEVAIRTMESDVKSMKQSGGVGVTPQIFTPGVQMPPQAETSGVEVRLGVPGYTGPEEAIFKPTGAIETKAVSQEGFNKWRLVFLIAGVLLLIFVFWLLGYFVIFPWLFPKQMPPVPTS